MVTCRVVECGSASRWCGSRCRSGFDLHLSPWCGSGCLSRFWLLFDAVSDPNFHPDADPDPDPSFQIKAKKTLKKAQIGLYSIHFGLSSANWCGSGSGSSLSLSLLCGSGCGFGSWFFRCGSGWGPGSWFLIDADPDADPVYQNEVDPNPQHW